MSFNIIATPQFKKEIKRLAKKYNSLKNEYANLIESYRRILITALRLAIIL
jgi:mRNA-degrading endonuclease RelE of RelBE toxin-antitoxin system